MPWLFKEEENEVARNEKRNMHIKNMANFETLH